MKNLILALLLITGVGFCGVNYIGASQTDIEGGYSSDKWNLGVGLRAFLYNINHPSRWDSNGDLEVSLFYLQKKLGQMKFQFGQSFDANYLYWHNSTELDPEKWHWERHWNCLRWNGNDYFRKNWRILELQPHIC